MLTPDFEQMWQRLLPDFSPDAIHEFNGYPEVVLAWAAYLGAAVAWVWDTGWEAGKEQPYSWFCGPRGFDYMDEHITEDILGYKLGSAEAEALAAFFRTKATEAYGLLRHSGVEPGTAEAYNAVMETLYAMYTLGASHILAKLGYKWTTA